MNAAARPKNRPLCRIAVIGAGIAGLACARTLRQAGKQVSVFEANAQTGGRMATIESPFGSFDVGAQYFTVRDERFQRALEAAAAGTARRWSANAVRVLDQHGRTVDAAMPARESHWVAVPRMNAIAQRWAEPLAADGALHLGARVRGIERDALDAGRWQLHVQGDGDDHPVHAGFDAVLLAVAAQPARTLLSVSSLAQPLTKAMAGVQTTPCWTLLLAFPQAAQPGLITLGPQWNAARSSHHRIAWLARESSKPGRAPIERWTVQASNDWSREHQGDDPARVTAKLLKAFAEITGIRAAPSWTHSMLWRDARTTTPLGRPFLWHAKLRLGACGDWCLGHRVEDAFVSGLELALTLARDV
ncbi:MAG: FAD-dependent oxidoreductase [Burkholderiaceae bacterium]|jgi:predicted NAD/FAD-dependent oxidoreductase|nr:FAD-dependent oxidoreductase [Burkholderiaceae bacterium]